MVLASTVDEVKDLLYQCEFGQALEIINSFYPEASPDEQFKLDIFKVQALFEMHRVDESKTLLGGVTAKTDQQSESYLYCAGRLAYLDNDHDRCERLFKLLAEQSENVTDYYRALIGLANTYYSTKRYGEIRRYFNEIEELYDVVPADSQFSFLLLKANYFYVADGRISESQKLFYDVITGATKKRWNYFIIKALYGLATISQKQNNQEALLANLQLLRCYLNPDESVYLTYLVNEQFKESNFTVHCGLQFDPEFKRIGIQGKWIKLHDKPLIYRFLELLNGLGRFVSKQEIAAELWPDQEYKSKMHDPRIFDIARRVRAMIEPYEDQPVCLLSGRYGYKLASPDGPPPEKLADPSAMKIKEEQFEAPSQS